MKSEGTSKLLNRIAGTTTRTARAEHVMLVDLGRRLCKAENRWPVDACEARYSHVHAPRSPRWPASRARAPGSSLPARVAGTVSGAPKVRAMQIISELEGYTRSRYAGAVGYALPNGALDTCITIRAPVS